ncbi:MAG: thioredoxin family protein [Heliobacteriaceae bacterium]|jgi:thiol-disulfide isomerase/thioredoxin|nr:thioredoxin family protein [Heliobacteriaceae bacterium]
MKKNLVIISLIFAVPLLAYWGLKTSHPTDAKNASGQPQVIKFASDMCIDCQKMSKVFKELKPKYGDRIAFVDINVQDNNPGTTSMIKKYNVTLVPTIILLSSDGKQFRRLEDAVPLEEMDGYLKELR